METDDIGRIITYEEYHPFGTTSYQATNAAITASYKRYRYTGMERDEETGLSYHNARYYIPWLGRWLNPDPIGIGDGVNVYAYCHNSPVMNSDRRGTQTKEEPTNNLIIKITDPEKRQKVQDALQKFTKDKVTIKEDGTVVIEENKDKKNSKPLGTKLLRDLLKPGSELHNIIINDAEDNPIEDKKGRSMAVPTDPSKASQPGVGSDVNIYLNFSDRIIAGEDGEEAAASFVQQLMHELIHAKHMVKGERSTDKHSGYGDPDNLKSLNNELTVEEYKTRLEEVKIDKELVKNGVEGVMIRATPTSKPNEEFHFPNLRGPIDTMSTIKIDSVQFTPSPPTKALPSIDKKALMIQKAEEVKKMMEKKQAEEKLKLSIKKLSFG